MEHCSDFKQSKQAENKIKNTCAIIARVFMVLFVLSVIGLLTYLGVSVHSFISNDDASLLSIFLSNNPARNGMYYSTAYVCTVSQYRKRQVAFN